MSAITLTKMELDEFVLFAADHIHFYNTIPCAFESSRGTLLDAVQCWELSQTLGIVVGEEPYA